MSEQQARAGRSGLFLVPQSETTETAPSVSFCSHCAARSEPTGPIASRVCETCGLGLLLQCGEDAAPAPGDPFLVLDSYLSVCALSDAAESLLGARETELVNRQVTEVLVPADVEAQGRENLAVAVTWAARGDAGTYRVPVRPANTFGVRLIARIASCGPPRAALVVLE